MLERRVQPIVGKAVEQVPDEYTIRGLIHHLDTSKVFQQSVGDEGVAPAAAQQGRGGYGGGEYVTFIYGKPHTAQPLGNFPARPPGNVGRAADGYPGVQQLL